MKYKASSNFGWVLPSPWTDKRCLMKLSQLSVPANDKHVGFDPKSLWVIGPCPVPRSSVLLWVRERWWERQYHRQMQLFLPTLLFRGPAPLCRHSRINDCSSPLPPWFQICGGGWGERRNIKWIIITWLMSSCLFSCAGKSIIRTRFFLLSFLTCL